MTTEHQRQTSVASSPTEMTRDEILAMFARRQDAYDDLDAAALAADYADDVDDRESDERSGMARPTPSGTCRRCSTAFIDLKMSFEPPIIDGKRVRSLGIAEGTNMGGLMGTSAERSRFTAHDRH